MSQRTVESDSGLPDPHVSIVLWRVTLEAIVATATRKRGERLLRLIAEKLADEEALAGVLSIRPNTHRAAAQKARHEAAELYAQLLPLLLARLAED